MNKVPKVILLVILMRGSDLDSILPTVPTLDTSIHQCSQSSGGL